MNMYEKSLKKKECEKCNPNFCCYSIVGPTGPTGPAGGPTGTTGDVGSQGIQGITGETGPTDANICT